jgi:exopolysaccharide biosynthesis polyprenyl glycosylphosphotransferase
MSLVPQLAARIGESADVPVQVPHLAGRRRLPKLSLLVFTGDLLVLVASYLLMILAIDQAAVDAGRVALWCLALMGAWVFAGSRRAYSAAILNYPLQSAYIVAKLTLVAGGIFYLLPLVGGGGHSRISNITIVLGVTLAMASWRIFLARFISRPMEDLVVVGAGWAGQALADAIARKPGCGMRIVGFVDADPQFVGRTIHSARVRPIEQLAELVRRPNGLARVVLANAGHAHTAVFDQLTTLSQAGVEVVQMSSLYEQVTGRIPVRHLGNYWWAVLPRPTADTLYWFGKRALDVALSLAGLMLLALCLPFLWPILRLQTGAPVLFSQVRVGKYGRPFTVRKLRTLRVSSGPQIDWRARKAANRPTAVCALIRAVGLDEVPQLWNVLRGEMSLVGPRPYVPEEVEDLQRHIPFFRSRALVRPGITGWAQINYGYGLSLEDEVEKLQHDLYYIGHQSTYLDLLILVRTVMVALRGRRPTSRVSLSALPKQGLYAWSRSDQVSAQ